MSAKNSREHVPQAACSAGDALEAHIGAPPIRSV
jgi:hypothetical protein